MIVLILFQSVFFTIDGVIYTEPETPAITENSADDTVINDTVVKNSSGDFIIFNNIKYKPDRFFILAVVSNICAFLLPAVFYIKLKGAGYSKKLKFDLPKLKYIPLTIYMFLALILGTLLINSLLFYSTGAEVNPETVLPFIFYTGGNPVYDMGILISFVILPAVCEEFFFRSVLAAEYEKHGSFCAAVITSAAFAMSHFSIKFFLPYFFAAMIIYILARITNSIIFAVIIHAGYNFYNIYLWDKLSGVLKFEQNRFIFIFITVIIFILCMNFVLHDIESIYYKKAYNNAPSPAFVQEIQKERKNQTRLSKYKSAAIVRLFISFISPTFIAAIIIFFIYIYI
jgi:membrane protease YdiL (CAAX protease family)